MTKSKINESMIDRKIKTVLFQSDYNGVVRTVINFATATDIAPEKKDDASVVADSKYGINTNHMPHNDFVNAMRRLTKHALAICDIDVASGKEDFVVIGVGIDGDLFLNQSRVTMTLAKRVDDYEKLMKMTTPQCTLSEQSKYRDWKQFQKDLEAMIKEAWAFIGGKHKDDEVPLAIQLEVFPKFDKVNAEPKKEKEAAAKKPATAKKKPEAVVPEPVVLGPRAQA